MSLQFVYDKIFENRLIRIYYSHSINEYIMRIYFDTRPDGNYQSTWIDTVKNQSRWEKLNIPNIYREKLLNIYPMLIFT